MVVVALDRKRALAFLVSFASSTLLLLLFFLLLYVIGIVYNFSSGLFSPNDSSILCVSFRFFFSRRDGLLLFLLFIQFYNIAFQISAAIVRKILESRYLLIVYTFRVTAVLFLCIAIAMVVLSFFDLANWRLFLPYAMLTGLSLTISARSLGKSH